MWRQKGTQLFYSAPIVKKHDFVTLQTADGLTVSIRGLINKTRTNENGIPSEVCNHFLVGFPYNWDHYQCHFGDIPFATSSFCLTNDQVNIELSGSNKNSVRKKSKDAPKGSTKAKQSSRLIAMNMRIDSMTVKDKTTLASLGSNLVNGDEMECELGGGDDEPHSLPAVNLIGLKEKENLASPNDAVTENKFGVAETLSSTTHGKMESAEAFVGSFEARRSSRLKNTKTGTHNKQDTEKKVIIDSLGSDLVTGDKVDCESGGKCVGDSSSTGQMNCLSDVLVGYPICSADTTNNPQETSRPYKLLADATNDMNRSMGRSDSRDNKRGKSQSKSKRQLEFITEPSTPITRNQAMKLSFLYPEESSCKRSKYGRLLVPPLDYWRNQQLLYDKSRAVAGVLNGLPVAESHTGSKSEPPRKKMKFT